MKLSRREALGIVGRTASGLALAGYGRSARGFSQFEPPPNIILIVSDDQRLDDMAVMVRTQTQLGAEGVTFANAYVTDPLCCPSRTSILTGLFVHNHRVYGNEAPKGGEPGFQKFGHEEGNIGLWLQRAGHKTYLAGKYLNHYKGGRVPPGWDEWDAIPTPPYPGADYTDRLRDQAIWFVRGAREPFFAFLNPIPPHYPHLPTFRHKGLFSERPFTPGVSWDEEDVRDKVSQVSDLPRITDMRDELAQVQRARLECLLAVDEMVEAVVEALRAVGRLENTYIIFTSDNGWLLGEHRFHVGKGVPYEEAVHMPLIIRGPGVPKGKKLDHLVSLVDIAPTFLELAGTSAPEPLDGKSWVPLLKENPLPTTQWRQAVLVEDDSWQAIRTKDFVYIRWNTGRELYDMRTDPGQMENLFYWAGQLPENRPPALRDMQLPPELAEIEREFNRLTNCRGAECR